MVQMSLVSDVIPTTRKPSSEWRFHAAIYRSRCDVNAVVHVHSPYATALSCTRQALPPVHYTIAMSGRDHIPCAPYAIFGSEALSANIVAALGEHGLACLMANHGMVCVGATLEQAMTLTEEIEFLCRVYALSRAYGEAHLLDCAQMSEVADGLRNYQRQHQAHER